MNRLLVLPLAVLLSGCFLEQNSRQISVEAEAEIEVTPDSFRMNAIIRSRAGDKERALSELSEKLVSLTEQLPTLEGLSSVTIEPSRLKIRPIFEQKCDDNRAYNEKEVCPIDGYFIEASIDIEGSPALVAGNVFSFASELGAEEIEFEEYFLADLGPAEREAEQKAFEKAQNKAQRLADAANVTLLGPIRISGDALRGPSLFFGGAQEDDTIIVTATRRQPKSMLSITPPPITVEREVSVTFEIE